MSLYNLTANTGQLRVGTTRCIRSVGFTESYCTLGTVPLTRKEKPLCAAFDLLAENPRLDRKRPDLTYRLVIQAYKL